MSEKPAFVGFRRGMARRLFGLHNMGLLLFLVLLWTVLSLLSPFFLRLDNALLVLYATATVMVVGVGMTFVIISGGVDLSVGAVAALAGMITGVASRDFGVGAGPAIIIGISAGILVGLINGSLISRFKLQPLIVTLGTMSVARGLTLVLTGGRPIFVVDPLLTFVGNGRLLGIPFPILVAGLVVVIGHCVLTYTEFGRYVYAIGGNEEATRLSGVNVFKNKVAIYMVSGGCAALVGVLLTGILGSSEPTVGLGLELQAIAVVAIGGTSLFGGVGGLIGTVLGAVLIGTIQNALTLLNIVSYWQQVIIGLVIIAAVLLEYARSRS